MLPIIRHIAGHESTLEKKVYIVVYNSDPMQVGIFTSFSRFRVIQGSTATFPISAVPVLKGKGANETTYEGT